LPPNSPEETCGQSVVVDDQSGEILRVGAPGYRYYVRLLDEGADVWRPVRATALPDGTFRLLEPDGYDPIAEKWEFPLLTKVRCASRKFTDGGEGLVAVGRV
jgi:hypothetical protein